MGSKVLPKNINIHSPSYTASHSRIKRNYMTFCSEMVTFLSPLYVIN